MSLISNSLNSVDTDLTIADYVVLSCGYARSIIKRYIPNNIIQIIVLFFNDIICIKVPRRTILWKSNELETRLDVVWQAMKVHSFGNKTGWKKAFDDTSLLFTKLYHKQCIIQQNKFDFDIYYETVYGRIYLITSLKNHSNHSYFAYYLNIYCKQNGKYFRQISGCSSTKWEVISLRDFVKSDQYDYLELNCAIKFIRFNKKSIKIQKSIDEYLLNNIDITEHAFYLINQNWGIICSKFDVGLFIHFKLLSLPLNITKIESRCSIEIKCDDSDTDSTIFEKKRTYNIYNGDLNNNLIFKKKHNFASLSQTRLANIAKMSFYVSIELLRVYVNNKSINKNEWAYYGVIDTS